MRLAASYRLAARSPAFSRWAISWLGAALIILAAANAEAATQQLTLQPSWNLVSFAVIPVDATPAAVMAPLGAKFKALWAYDAVNKKWNRFPQGAPGIATITTVEPGRGYWLEVTSAATLDVVGASDALAPGPDQVAPEWNLVGFPLVQNTAYERVLNNAAIRQIWTFDAVLGSFQGVIIDEQGLVIREDFLNLEPGRGYWIRSVSQEAISLAAELRTGLPMDVDLPPILTSASVTERVPWPLTQGDVDVGRDGFYDRAATQRGLDFGDRIYQHQLTISNQGSGLLTYRAAVVDPDNCEWLRILETDPTDGSTTRVTEVSGAVSIERARIVLMATRDKMGIGEHQCDFVVNSNGAGPDDANRLITVRMRVGDLEGDYRLRVQFDSVNGKAADLANPRITLGLYPDSDGLKAVVDGFRTLLIPRNVKLAGRQIETGTTRFEVSGSFETPADDPGNPFGAAVRRDITIRGERADRSAADGVILGSQDVLGEYFETIRGVTAEPIRLVGTFTGERLSSFATVRDRDEMTDSASGNIPDPGVLERTLSFTDRLLIDEVDIALNLVHTRPADLVVSLIAPDETTEVILRANSQAPLFNQIFDEFAVPLESLAAFNGMRADGDWTLRIEDEVGGETGSLLNWSLDIRGTAVFDLAGSAPSLPVGTTLVLTGCGRTEITTTEADNSFRFTDLIDCVYQITVQEPGFGTNSQEIVLDGADREDLVFNPASGAPLTINPVQLIPGAGPGPWFSQGIITHDVVSAWQSGDIDDNQQTEISATVFGPGTLSFWWKVSSEETFDFLRFYMDAVEQTTAAPGISGDQDWARVTVAVPAGSHVVQWRYAKDVSLSSNADAAWVDEVQISTELAPRQIVMPSGAQGIFVSLTTAGGAGATLPSGELQYGLDAASFDLDRLPLSPSSPGPNDSDAFDAFEDALTRSNTYVELGNGTIDPPVGTQARRITINIGMPVVGRSVQGDLRLSVGANP